MSERFSSFEFLDSSDGIQNFERQTVFQNDVFHVERIRSTFSVPFSTSFELPEGIGGARIKLAGAALVRNEGQCRWDLACPNTIGVRVGPNRTTVRAARGFHELYMVYWNVASIESMAHSIPFFQGETRMPESQRLAPYQAIFPHFEVSFRRFMRAVDPENLCIAPLLLTSVLADALAFLMQGKGLSQLAPVPLDLPSTIQDLIESVRLNPGQPWPLKLAAEEAGYSPFHFSRSFKQLTGFGFHEFVDRTRTEAAVELLSSTSNSVDSVAMSTGYGSTQGMRESIREYIGLAPSEIRAEPEELPAHLEVSLDI